LNVLIILLAIPTALFAQQGDANSLAYPVGSPIFGMTYGDWQAAYLQYFFSIPASINPTLDTTGADCNVAQSSGPVFFLNSAFLGSFLTRTCTVSASKALLLPVAWWECSNVEAPPSYGANPQAMRTCAGAVADGIGVKTLKLTVDGKELSELLRSNRAQSPYYNFTMPATDNILGLDGITSGSSVSDGYLVMLKPLCPGNHVIHFEGDYVSGPAAPGPFGVTYYLTVQ
jgi:hypothetical protein